MLVDDDDVTNFVNESLVEDEGVAKELLVAKNGQEALNLIQEKKFDTADCPKLILLDINMPVMNGFEFLKAYQQWQEGPSQSIIIVMLTSSLNPEDVAHARGGRSQRFSG